MNVKVKLSLIFVGLIVLVALLPYTGAAGLVYLGAIVLLMLVAGFLTGVVVMYAINGRED